MMGKGLRGTERLELRGRMLRGARIMLRTRVGSRTVISSYTAPKEPIERVQVRKGAGSKLAVRADGRPVDLRGQHILRRGP